jgi:hypothetical protein
MLIKLQQFLRMLALDCITGVYGNEEERKNKRKNQK